MSQLSDSSSSWAIMLNDPEAATLIGSLDESQKQAAKRRLEVWIQASSGSSLFRGTKSENRQYKNWRQVAAALVGEIQSRDNLTKEKNLSSATRINGYVIHHVRSFISRLRGWHQTQNDDFQKGLGGQRGRYRTYYGTSGVAYTLGRGKTLRTRLLEKTPTSLDGLVTLAADYAVAAGKRVEVGRAIMDSEHENARKKGTHWNPNEDAAWTREARRNLVPLSAGPSATTACLMHLGQKINAPPEELEALAWAIFAFFNSRLHLNKSGTHRFHEVMCVAARYGVKYNKWQYPVQEPSGVVGDSALAGGAGRGMLRSD